MGSISGSVASVTCRLCGIKSTRENMLRFCCPFAVDFTEQEANSPEAVQRGRRLGPSCGKHCHLGDCSFAASKSKPLMSRRGLEQTRVDDLSI